MCSSDLSEARVGGDSVSVIRGDIRFFVLLVPAQEVTGEPSFVAGYPIKPGSVVTIKIGSNKFDMFSDPDIGGGERVWPTPSDDANLIDSMKRGSHAIITGLSSRGTTTIDTISLTGFTAALDAIKLACK